MLDRFLRRRPRPKPLAEMTPEELDAALADRPALAMLLRHTLGLMQFAPARTADAVLARVSTVVDEALRRRLSPAEEHDYVMRELELIRRELLGDVEGGA